MRFWIFPDFPRLSRFAQPNSKLLLSARNSFLYEIRFYFPESLTGMSPLALTLQTAPSSEEKNRITFPKTERPPWQPLKNNSRTRKSFPAKKKGTCAGNLCHAKRPPLVPTQIQVPPHGPSARLEGSQKPYLPHESGKLHQSRGKQKSKGVRNVPVHGRALTKPLLCPSMGIARLAVRGGPAQNGQIYTAQLR